MANQSTTTWEGSLNSRIAADDGTIWQKWIQRWGGGGSEAIGHNGGAAFVWMRSREGASHHTGSFELQMEKWFVWALQGGRLSTFFFIRVCGVWLCAYSGNFTLTSLVGPATQVMTKQTQVFGCRGKFDSYPGPIDQKLIRLLWLVFTCFKTYCKRERSLKSVVRCCSYWA